MKINTAEYLVSKLLKNETCYIGAPKSIRDYMFVDDHVNAYLLAMKSEKATGEVFNVSPSNPVTNEKLASILSKIIGFNGKIEFGSYPPGYPSRPIAQDPDYLVLDSTKIRENIGWKPTVNLDEGLRKTKKLENQSLKGLTEDKQDCLVMILRG